MAIVIFMSRHFTLDVISPSQLVIIAIELMENQETYYGAYLSMLNLSSISDIEAETTGFLGPASLCQPEVLTNAFPAYRLPSPPLYSCSDRSTAENAC